MSRRPESQPTAAGRPGRLSERNMNRLDRSRPRAPLAFFSALILATALAARSQEIGPDCIAVALNRQVQVSENGAFSLGNVPVPTGAFRVRLVCANAGGDLAQAASSLLFGVARGNTLVGQLSFAATAPAPLAISLSSPATALDAAHPSAQLAVSGLFVGGISQDLTAATAGTAYTSSNPAVASVYPDGLVTALASGTVLVTARNEGAVSSLRLTVSFANDSDGDGLPDDYELANANGPGGSPGLDPQNPADSAADFDSDGLTNLQEFQAGTNLFSADTDGDGLSDSQELALGSSPLAADSDGDGLLDGAELLPDVDTDGDGLINVLDPDSDGDGLPDGIEARLGLSPLLADSNSNGIPDGSEDFDGDFLVNAEELALGTDPTNPDTDGDGLADGTEVFNGSDPLVPERIPPTVAFLSPQAGAVLEGQTLTFSLDANDNAVLREVKIQVNGTDLETFTQPPFEASFTVPKGSVPALVFTASARDQAGNVASTPPLALAVSPDPGTLVMGRLVDQDGNGVPGATVTLHLQGLRADAFDSASRLTSLPNLDGATPDATFPVTGLGFANPDGLLSPDPFGTGFSPDFAARFSGILNVPVSGRYEVSLQADDGARLSLDGSPVLEVPVAPLPPGNAPAGLGARAASQTFTVLDLYRGAKPLQVDYFQAAGAAELKVQVRYRAPIATSSAVTYQGKATLPGFGFVENPRLALEPSPYSATTDANGQFFFPSLPAAFGAVRASTTVTLDGVELRAGAGPVNTVPAGTTDLGTLTLGQRSCVAGRLQIFSTCLSRDAVTVTEPIALEADDGAGGWIPEDTVLPDLDGRFCADLVPGRRYRFRREEDCLCGTTTTCTAEIASSPGNHPLCGDGDLGCDERGIVTLFCDFSCGS
ncbi:MAG: PA14 domain-containing protein [Thermoanaerobaculia bacterium]